MKYAIPLEMRPGTCDACNAIYKQCGHQCGQPPASCPIIELPDVAAMQAVVDAAIALDKYYWESGQRRIISPKFHDKLLILKEKLAALDAGKVKP